MLRNNWKMKFFWLAGNDPADPMQDFLSDLSVEVPEVELDLTDASGSETEVLEVKTGEEAAPEPQQDAPPEADVKAPEVTPVPEVKPEEVETPTPVAVPEQPSEEQLQAQIEKLRGELEVRYAVSDEDADLIATDPQKVLPRLMANMHMMMQGEFLNMITRALPQMMQQYNAQTSVVNQAQEIFNRDFPDVNKAPPELLQQAIAHVNKQIPNASLEERVKRVGQVVYAMMGVAPAAPAPAVQKAAPKPKPQSPVRGSVAPSAPAPQGEMESFFASLDRG